MLFPGVCVLFIVSPCPRFFEDTPESPSTRVSTHQLYSRQLHVCETHFDSNYRFAQRIPPPPFHLAGVDPLRLWALWVPFLVSVLSTSHVHPDHVPSVLVSTGWGRSRLRSNSTWDCGQSPPVSHT